MRSHPVAPAEIDKEQLEGQLEGLVRQARDGDVIFLVEQKNRSIWVLIRFHFSILAIMGVESTLSLLPQPDTYNPAPIACLI